MRLINHRIVAECKHECTGNWLANIRVHNPACCRPESSLAPVGTGTLTIAWSGTKSAAVAIWELEQNLTCLLVGSTFP